MDCGVIGYKNHAKKIVDLLKKKKKQTISYHPTNKTADTNNFLEILKCKSIFIASPNNTHFNYINKIINLNYKGYIFCEKPIVSKKSELKKILKKINYKKFYINLNLNRSFLFSKLKNIVNNNIIGNILYVNLAHTHGYANTKSYLKEWRSKKNYSSGLIENLGIHYIHLFYTLFGKIKVIDKNELNALHNGSSNDTASIRMISKNLTSINIFLSYATVKKFEIKIFGTKGFVEISDNKFLVYSKPKIDKFTERTMESSIKSRIKYNNSINWSNSLNASIDYFLNHVESKSFFLKKDFEHSTESSYLAI